MNDQKFSELINLYLDGEISSFQEVQLLKVIDENPDRAREFSKARSLNTAMEMVLDPKALQPRDLVYKPRFGAAIWLISSICIVSLLCIGLFLSSILISPLNDSDIVLSNNISQKKWVEFSTVDAQYKLDSLPAIFSSQMNKPDRLLLSKDDNMRVMNLSSLRLRQTSLESQWNRVDDYRSNITHSNFNDVSNISVFRTHNRPFGRINTSSPFKEIRANMYSGQN